MVKYGHPHRYLIVRPKITRKHLFVPHSGLDLGLSVANRRTIHTKTQLCDYYDYEFGNYHWTRMNAWTERRDNLEMQKNV